MKRFACGIFVSLILLQGVVVFARDGYPRNAALDVIHYRMIGSLPFYPNEV